MKHQELLGLAKQQSIVYGRHILEGSIVIRTCAKVLFICVTATVLNLAQSRADDDALFRVIPLGDPIGFELGRGFDILSGNPRSDCVERSSIEDHKGLGPSGVSFRSEKVENSTQLDKTLGVSASASVTAGSWGGSASASFSNAMSVSSYDLTYVVNVSVTGKGDSLRDVKLKDQFAKLIASGKEGSLKRFHDLCGDGFIGELSVGGDFKAVIQIHTKSKAESESLSASVSASFSIASGSAAFSSTLKTLAKTNEIQIWTFRRGGSGPLPLTPDEMATTAANLPDNVKATPGLVGAAVFSYLTILDDLSIPLSDFQVREATLSKLAELSRQARDQEADAQYILDHPSQFFSQPNDLPRLATEIMQLEAFRAHLREKGEACVKAAGECSTDNESLPSATARPARK